jgi:hypothetical protein
MGITPEYLKDALIYLLDKYGLSDWKISSHKIYDEDIQGDIPIAINAKYPGLYLQRIFSAPSEEGVLLLHDIPEPGQEIHRVSAIITCAQDLAWEMLLAKHHIRR